MSRYDGIGAGTFSGAMVGENLGLKSVPESESAGENDLAQDVDQSFQGFISEKKSGSHAGGLGERIAARGGFNPVRLNPENIRPAGFSVNPEITSPYLTIPPGLSPTTLLESPVFLTNSLVQPSPTTGKFSFLQNGNSSALTTEAHDKIRDNFFEDIDMPSFSFTPDTKLDSSSIQGESSKITTATCPQQSFPVDVSAANQEGVKGSQTDHSRLSAEQDLRNYIEQSNKRVNDTLGAGEEVSPSSDELQDEDQRGSGVAIVPSEDGYNWRKYGQKQVRGSEYPRSYYKCTNLNCQVKKKVERSNEGHITEIIYKGAHNHPKPPSPTRRLTNGSSSSQAPDMQLVVAEQPNPHTAHDGRMNNGSSPIRAPDMQVVVVEQSSPYNGTDCDDRVWAKIQNWGMENVEVTSSASTGHEFGHQSSSMQCQNGSQVDPNEIQDISSAFTAYDAENDQAAAAAAEEESESKRRRHEVFPTETSGASRTIREPRVMVQTTSDVDILDDGYRWRKYGQKVVKGNPNPRSYYKCTSAGCMVRKHVERASHDLASVITTYEGKHNHDVPAPRNSSHNNNGVMPQAHQHDPNNNMGGYNMHAPYPQYGHQLGISHGYHYPMNQPNMGNPSTVPVHNPYIVQQQQYPVNVNVNGFSMQPQMAQQPGLNMSSNSSTVYQQVMGGGRMPLGRHM